MRHIGRLGGLKTIPLHPTQTAKPRMMFHVKHRLRDIQGCQSDVLRPETMAMQRQKRR